MATVPKTSRPKVEICGPALIKRCGALLEISLDGDEPLDFEVISPLLPSLEYDHKSMLYGKDAIDYQTGEHRGLSIERKRLYHFDAGGRLVTGTGFVDRVFKFLRDAGRQISWVDATPISPRPDCFVLSEKRLRYHPEFMIQPGDQERVATILAGGPPASPDDVEAVAAARRVLQRAVAEVIIRRASKGMGCLIQAPPGFGKSYMVALLAILLPKARIVLAVPDIDNFEKSWRHLTHYIADVGRLGAGHQRMARVTVSTFGSLHHVDDDVDIIIVDEAHKAGAGGVTDRLLGVGPRAIRVGLTATPVGRLDNADLVLEFLFGPVKYRRTWPEATSLGMIVPISVRWLSVDLPFNPAAGCSSTTKKKYGIWRNKGRNQIIARAAKTIPAEEQTVIMVATVEHLLALKQMLPDYEVVYGSHDADRFERFNAADLVEEGFEPITPERREAMRRGFEANEIKKVIATLVWSTGVSFDALSNLIRGDASGSAIMDEQIPGRTSRSHAASGKLVGRVIDCLDEFDRGYASAAQSRSRNYRDKGWEQEFPKKRSLT